MACLLDRFHHQIRAPGEPRSAPPARSPRLRSSRRFSPTPRSRSASRSRGASPGTREVAVSVSPMQERRRDHGRSRHARNVAPSVHGGVMRGDELERGRGRHRQPDPPRGRARRDARDHQRQITPHQSRQRVLHLAPIQLARILRRRGQRESQRHVRVVRDSGDPQAARSAHPRFRGSGSPGRTRCDTPCGTRSAPRGPRGAEAGRTGRS